MLLSLIVAALAATAAPGRPLPLHPGDTVRTDTTARTATLRPMTDSAGRTFYRIREVPHLDNPAYRVLASDGSLLFMSPAPSDRRPATIPGWTCLRAADIAAVEVLKGGVVTASVGRAYEQNGVVAITLTPGATSEWRAAEAAFRATGRAGSCPDGKLP